MTSTPSEPTRTPQTTPTRARRIVVSAPSRLHFGLLSWGGPGRQFGGGGVMIRHPGVTLIAEPADEPEAEFSATGPRAERVLAFATRWQSFHGDVRLPAWRFQIQTAAREHVGLGTGTQLALAVAAALQRISGRPFDATHLAAMVGRGQRSAVGSHGFCHGGLIIEPGKAPGETLSPLTCRIALPDEWRIVLVCPRALDGLCGADEQRAFAQLPPVAPATTARLTELLIGKLAPAARAADFATFSEAVYEYGHLAGLCFASQQGGPYNGPRLTALVEQIRRRGIRGVGQSSWGPTLFCLLPDDSAARELVTFLQQSDPRGELELQVTTVDNRGAQIAEVDRAGSS